MAAGNDGLVLEWRDFSVLLAGVYGGCASQGTWAHVDAHTRMSRNEYTYVYSSMVHDDKSHFTNVLHH